MLHHSHPVKRMLTPSEQLKLFAGLAVQPFLAAAVSFVLFPLLLLDRTGSTLAGGIPASQTDAAISVAAGAGIVALFVTAIGVFPTALWLVTRRPVPLIQALLFGLAFANLPMVLGTVFAGTYGVEGALRGVAFASCLGLAGAAAFWLIALRASVSSNVATR